MRKRSAFFLVFIIVVINVFLVTGCGSKATQGTQQSNQEPSLIKVRIGWQVPWAIQGQLVQILKHTDILKNNGLQAEFVGKTYGPELNEAALAGAVDVILTADQPAATLFSKDKGWIGIGRLMYNRTLTYVPPKSPVNSIKDLKGKTIGVPVGAAAERITVEALKKAGLDPKKDVKMINVGIMEQGPLITKGKDVQKWGNIDALSGFDPTPAIFESKDLVKVLDVGKVCSLVVMNKDYIKKNPEVAEKLMKAMVEAYDYYRLNVHQANSWFIQESKLADANDDVCNIAASTEPNLIVKSKDEIRVWFTDEDFKMMQKGANFIESTINKKVNMKDYVSNEYVKFNMKSITK